MIKFNNYPTDSRRITSSFGTRSSGWHDGIDIGAVKAGVEGDNIYAVADGEVIISKVNGGGVKQGYGYYVALKHDGFCTLYGHLQGLIVKVGQKVKAGEVIGKMGNTGKSSGAHLHFRLINSNTISFTKGTSGNTLDSIDPIPFLEAIGKEKELVSSWAKEAQEWVKEKGISDGSRPKDSITREEVWTMLFRLNNLK